MSVLRSLLIVACLVCFSDSARAGQSAIALHGAPKYKPGFTHFEIVNPNAPKGGEIRLSAVGTFDSTHPFILKGEAVTGVSTLVYESLMDQSTEEPFTLYAHIADTIDVADDKSSVTFTLNPKARWHDGEPITADDVVWTFNTLIEKGAPFFKAYYGAVKSVEAKNASTVRFVFSTPGNTELPLIVAQLPVLPKHFWATRKFEETTLSAPLGSGPYKLEALTPGRSVTYKRVADWWAADLPSQKGKYNFDTIRFDYYLDQTVALEAFFAGQYDVQQENIAKQWATAYNVPSIKDGRIIKAEIDNQRPMGMQAFIFNTRRALFADPKVRQALAYAFDFESSNRQFAFSAYARTDSFFENSDLAATGLPSAAELKLLEPLRAQIPPEVFTQIYAPPKTDGTGNARTNLKTASDLLDAAGYKLGPDGVRVHAETGTKLAFEFIDNNPAFERWIQPFVRNLKRIGVAATYRTIDPSQYQNRMQNYDFDMTVNVIAQSESPGNELYDFWGSAKADVPGSRNLIGIKNPAVDALIEHIVTAKTYTELQTATRALDRVLLWNHYVIPNWYYGKWRLAWWNKFDKPEKLSPKDPGILETWWVKPTPEQAPAATP